MRVIEAAYDAMQWLALSPLTVTMNPLHGSPRGAAELGITTVETTRQAMTARSRIGVGRF